MVVGIAIILEVFETFAHNEMPFDILIGLIGSPCVVALFVGFLMAD